MNLLDALAMVRNCSLASAQMHTRQGQAAIKVIDRKLVALERKKAWRGHNKPGMPSHMHFPIAEIPDCAAFTVWEKMALDELAQVYDDYADKNDSGAIRIAKILDETKWAQTSQTSERSAGK